MNLRRASLLLAAVLAGAAHANPAPFDLAGPTLEVKVTRGDKTLPATQVPDLAVGDRLWVKADLPSNQSAHYLLVAAFLSGSTNPPSEDWFLPCKTWKGKCAREGLSVTVPDGAQQVLVFLAPETSGDFRTLVGAVRGRPGAFVRTSQDLNQAELDRSRLERYLTSIRRLSETDPQALKETAPLLARSLAIKVEEKCLDRVPELQAPCLMQGQESLILNDGHSTSIVGALTAASDIDALMAASSTPQLGYGYYSPYIASVVDIARLMDSFRTAVYQYIPALASQRDDRFDLALNAAPSFNDPKSVLVVALPAIQPPRLPPLHAVDPKAVYCAGRADLVLPVEGAPLVFSTAYAHDLRLSLTGSDGKTVELPARADPAQGGYVIDTSALQTAAAAEPMRATLRGYWGFEPYQGPVFQLRTAHAAKWALAPEDESALVAGRKDTVHLQADSVSCVEGIALKDADGRELKAEWKPVNPNEVEVTVPLQDAQPGAMTLLVRQYGLDQAQAIPVQVFADAGRFDGFTIHAGDSQGVLKGTSLTDVASLSLGGLSFVPGDLSLRHAAGELPMVAKDAEAAAALKPDSATARVLLKDGRAFRLTATVAPPRPRASLIAKGVQLPDARLDSNIQLANEDELPQDARLTFSVRAQAPANFARDETVEVATADGSFSATLSLDNGGLRLEDARIAVATLYPAKAFGSSAFGPLQFRVSLNGAAGDWLPLATLVRLPALKELQCPAAAELPCKLSGADLFLVDSVSGDPGFDHPVQVPDGFPGTVLPVPHPGNGRLYVKLRDDPSVINLARLEAQPLPAVSDAVARAAADAASHTTPP